jgi:hypothetical protein
VLRSALNKQDIEGALRVSALEKVLDIDSVLVFHRHKCVRCCALAMDSIGSKEFHEGLNWLLHCIGSGLAVLGPRVVEGDDQVDWLASHPHH